MNKGRALCNDYEHDFIYEGDKKRSICRKCPAARDDGGGKIYNREEECLACKITHPGQLIGTNTEGECLKCGQLLFPKIVDMERICDHFRGHIKVMADGVLALKSHPDISKPEDFPGQIGEMCANIMLSYRHLEDARMRLGKVMQQIQGGVSKFDKPPYSKDQWAGHEPLCHARRGPEAACTCLNKPE